MDSVRAYFLGLSPKTEYPHAPNAKQISLNSPKYGQAHLSFMSQGMAVGNHPSSPSGSTAVGDSYHFQNDSLSS